MTKKQLQLLAKLYLAYKLEKMYDDADFYELIQIREEVFPGGITADMEEEVKGEIIDYSNDLSGKHIRFNSIEEIYNYVIKE